LSLFEHVAYGGLGGARDSGEEEEKKNC